MVGEDLCAIHSRKLVGSQLFVRLASVAASKWHYKLPLKHEWRTHQHCKAVRRAMGDDLD